MGGAAEVGGALLSLLCSPGGGTPAGLMTACSLRNSKERVSFQPCDKDLVYKKKGAFLISISVKIKKRGAT